MDSGFAFTAGFDRQRSIWNLSSGLTVISDEFNPNDVGRLHQNNYINLFGGFFHQINDGRPVGPFQRGDLRLFGDSGFSYRDLLSNGIGFYFSSDWTKRGFQEIELGIRIDYLLGGYDVTGTSGLGPRARPREANFDIEVTSDTQRIWQLQLRAEAGFYGNGGLSPEKGPKVERIASSRVDLSLEMGMGREYGATEWASNEAFTPASDGQWFISESWVPSRKTSRRGIGDNEYTSRPRGPGLGAPARGRSG